MFPASSSGGAAPSAAVAAAGLDHARLSYHYLDSGDIDGYVSLLHDDVVVRRPGVVPMRGRHQVERTQSERSRAESSRRPRRRHVVDTMFAGGDRVAAIGRVSDSPGRRSDLEFVDIFTVSDCGLLIAQATYFFTAPE